MHCGRSRSRASIRLSNSVCCSVVIGSCSLSRLSQSCVMSARRSGEVSRASSSWESKFMLLSIRETQNSRQQESLAAFMRYRVEQRVRQLMSRPFLLNAVKGNTCASAGSFASPSPIPAVTPQNLLARIRADLPSFRPRPQSAPADSSLWQWQRQCRPWPYHPAWSARCRSHPPPA